MNEFSEKIIETQKLVHLAIEQCKQIQFYHEKAIDYSEEMLKLLDKLNDKGELND
jgi:ribosome-binding factor A